MLELPQWLAEHEGAEVDWLPVDRLGRVDVEALRAALDRDPASVALVSVMWANNEVGTVQPVAEIVEVARLARRPGALATRCRRSASCRSTSPPAGSTR